MIHRYSPPKTSKLMAEVACSFLSYRSHASRTRPARTPRIQRNWSVGCPGTRWATERGWQTLCGHARLLLTALQLFPPFSRECQLSCWCHYTAWLCAITCRWYTVCQVNCSDRGANAQHFPQHPHHLDFHWTMIDRYLLRRASNMRLTPAD